MESHLHIDFTLSLQNGAYSLSALNFKPPIHSLGIQPYVLWLERHLGPSNSTEPTSVYYCSQAGCAPGFRNE